MKSTDCKIIHIDMDCFYAAVEMRDRPDLKTKPLAVGGRPESRGVITTCNYIARRYKVHSALSSREAVRRCPQLIILPPRFSVYKEESRKIREIFKKYTDLIEPLSLDEAYLDLTANTQFNGSASKTAFQIRKDIYNETGLTASAGIANSKFLAKVASDWNKPNNQFTVQPKDVEKFVYNLPLKKISGVGKQTQKKLKSLNLETCGDMQKYDLTQMTHLFGSFGERLYDLCRGVDSSKVKPHRVRKSISVETTLKQNTLSWEFIEKEIEKLFDELSFRMATAEIDASQIKSMNVKYKFENFQNLSKEKAVTEINLNLFKQLAHDHFLENSEPIRLIGIGYKLNAKNRKKARQQLDFF